LKKLTKNISIRFFITVVISIILLHSASAFSADISEPPVFMDLESSVKELRDRISKVFPSIVMIVVYDITGEESARGSGFFYDTDGRIITNASLFNNAYSAEVISNKNRYSIVSVLNYDDRLDTAIIEVNAVNEPHLELDFESKLATDEKVLAVGRIDNFRQTLSEGIINSVVHLDGNIELIKGNTVTPLLSLPPSENGPLLNSEGKVIGLTSYNISDSAVMENKTIIFSGQTINAISVHSIIALIETSNSPTLLHPKKSRIWWLWFKHKVKTFAISGFITLYTMGFPIIILYILLFVIVISIVQFIFQQIKKKFF